MTAATFSINGTARSVDIPDETRLIDLLQDQGALAPRAGGCGTGACGGCVVLVDDRPVAACLALALPLSATRIETAQGDAMALVRGALEDRGAGCPACRDGLTVALTHALRISPWISAEEARAAILGHRCTCTAAETVAAAALDAAALLQTHGATLPALPAPAALAGRELARDALAAETGRDPLDARLGGADEATAAVLRAAAAAHGWAGPAVAPLAPAGRLIAGSGLAVAGPWIGRSVAACAEVVVDRDTGHTGLARLTLALPGTGNRAALAAAAARGLAQALADGTGAFALPDITWAEAAPDPAPAILSPLVEAAVTAAVLCALAQAADILPADPPMTTDRVLGAILAATTPAHPAEGAPHAR